MDLLTGGLLAGAGVGAVLGGIGQNSATQDAENAIRMRRRARDIALRQSIAAQAVQQRNRSRQSASVQGRLAALGAAGLGSADLMRASALTLNQDLATISTNRMNERSAIRAGNDQAVQSIRNQMTPLGLAVLQSAVGFAGTGLQLASAFADAPSDTTTTTPSARQEIRL
jgi:hypothetical protein